MLWPLVQQRIRWPIYVFAFELRLHGGVHLASGNWKYIPCDESSLCAGTYHWVAVAAHNNYVAGRCSFDFSTEIFSLSPSRIEGRTLFLLANSKIDFKHCSHSKNLVWQNFVWIPEQKGGAGTAEPRARTVGPAAALLRSNVYAKGQSLATYTSGATLLHPE